MFTRLAGLAGGLLAAAALPLSAAAPASAAAPTLPSTPSSCPVQQTGGWDSASSTAVVVTHVPTAPGQAAGMKLGVISLNRLQNGISTCGVPWSGSPRMSGDRGTAIQVAAANPGAVGFHGYYVVTAEGNVYNFGGAPWYGSLAARELGRENVVGMVTAPNGGGYTLVTRTGGVFPFGPQATWHGNFRSAGGFVDSVSGTSSNFVAMVRPLVPGSKTVAYADTGRPLAVQPGDAAVLCPSTTDGLGFATPTGFMPLSGAPTVGITSEWPSRPVSCNPVFPGAAVQWNKPPVTGSGINPVGVA